MPVMKNYKSATLAVTTAFAGGASIPRNDNRKGLTIWNTSAVDVQFSLQSTEIDLITIPAGQHLAWLEGIPQNQIYFKAGSAVNIVYWEA